MKPYWQINGSKLYQGNVLDVLQALPPGICHCSITSPPYWGLRSYPCPPVEWPPVQYAPMAGLPEIEIPGCDSGCVHEWGEERITSTGRQDVGRADAPGGLSCVSDKYGGNKQASQGQWCALCGGWRGSLGLEPTVEAFIGHIVLIWRELWRVLRDDGVSFVNFGDSYAASTKGSGGMGKGITAARPNSVQKSQHFEPRKMKLGGLKPKDLCMIPARVALALQADGWYLRSDIIWAKGISFCPTYSGSCMPESVRDRPTNSYEHVFLLAKSKRYYYDGDAVREPSGDPVGSAKRYESAFFSSDKHISGGYSADGAKHTAGIKQWNGSRNLRTVWTHPDADAFLAYCAQQGIDLDTLAQEFYDGQKDIKDVFVLNPGSYKGAHFATFPPALVEPMIKAGTSERGCCPKCGASWERVTGKTGERVSSHWAPGTDQKTEIAKGKHGSTSTLTTGYQWLYETTGWRPTCTCEAGDPIPCTVLDPFLGSGTVAEVATRLRRQWIGIELSKTYCDEHIIPRLSRPIQQSMLLDI